MEADDAIDVFGAVREQCATWPRIFLLQDFHELESIPLETRRGIHQATSWMPLAGTAFFGASFPVRAVATMLMNVANLTRGGKNPFEFFGSESAARAFLDDLREGKGDAELRSDVALSELSVERARVDTLLIALSCASVDEFDVPEAFLEARADDRFGLLEAAFQIFVEELAITKIAMKRLLTDAEAARAELQTRLETIELQRATISELSTPMIEVWDGILTLPIVGALDPARANGIMEALLARIVEKRIRTVIVDLTGVETVVADTADQLNRMSASVRLLGAECMLAGLTPQVAQTLAALQVDFKSLRTVRTLHEALTVCLDV